MEKGIGSRENFQAEFSAPHSVEVSEMKTSELIELVNGVRAIHELKERMGNRESAV